MSQVVRFPDVHPACIGMYLMLIHPQYIPCDLLMCIGAVQPLSYLSWLFLGESEKNLPVPCQCWKYVLVLVCQCTSTYQYVRPLNPRTYTVLYRYVLAVVRTGMYHFARSCTRCTGFQMHCFFIFDSTIRCTVMGGAWAHVQTCQW